MNQIKIISETTNSQTIKVSFEDLNGSKLNAPRSAGSLPKEFTIPKNVKENLVITKFQFGDKSPIEKLGCIINKDGASITESQFTRSYLKGDTDTTQPRKASDYIYIFPDVAALPNRLEMTPVSIFEHFAGKTFVRKDQGIDVLVGKNYVGTTPSEYVPTTKYQYFLKTKA